MNTLKTMNGWKYYKHAMLPTCQPHENADITIFKKKNLWKMEQWKKAYFARYTSNWDCTENTGWYWIIKDSPLNIRSLPSKYRYEINRGLSNYKIKIINNPKDYENELYKITCDGINGYSKAYRRIPDQKNFLKNINNKKKIFGAFDQISDELCGYIIVEEREEVINYLTLKVYQKCEKKYINSALVYGMIDYYQEKLCKGIYIADGERNISHETNHQEWLCKKMCFRKVYCKLNIIYRPYVKYIVNILYPFRKIFVLLKNINYIFHAINSVMKMEELRRISMKMK